MKQTQPERKLSPFKIVVIYILAGGLWILFSDIIIGSMIEDPHLLTRVQTYKGWLFVSITGLLLYWLVNRYKFKMRLSDDVLVESEERFRAIASNTPDHILMQDKELRYIFVVNPQLGLTEQDMIGKTDYDFLSKEEADKLTRTKRQVLESGAPLHFETSLISKDGKQEFFEGTCVPRYDPRGNVDGIIGYFRNVTERKKAEAALRESEKKYKELVENANSIILRWTRDGEITYMNEFGQKFFDYTKSEIIGRHVVGTIVPEIESTGRDLRPLMDKICADPKKFESNINENMRKNGERVWIAWTNKVVMDEKGQIMEIMSIGSDITERKKGEEALHRSEEWFRSLFENMQEGYAHCRMIFDDEDRPVDFVYLNVNSSFERLTGLKDVVGKKETEIFPGVKELHPEMFETFGRVALTGKPEKYEIDFKPLKQVFILSIYSIEKGYCVLTFDNITERKKAEEALAADMKGLTNLLQIGSLFIREGGFQEVLDEIVKAAIDISNADMGNIQLLDPQSGNLEIVAQHGFEQHWVDFWNNVGKGKGVCGAALELGKRVIVEDITQDSIFADTPAMDVQLTAGVRAVQSTPLMSREGKLLGMFSTHFCRPHRPDERTLHLLDLLARQTADIIERKKAEEELRITNEELLSINRIISTTTTTTTTTTTGVKKILENVLDESLSITGLEGGTICLVKAGSALHLAAQRETSDATIKDLTENAVRIGECLCGECARDHKPLILWDRNAVLEFSTREAQRGEDIRFHAVFPLIIGKRCLGVLCVFTRTDKKPTERSLKLLETVTAQIAIAVDNAQMFEEIAQHAAILENKVRERTIELKDSQTALMNIVDDLTKKSEELRSANERLKELDRLKSMFIASMSHELRTPLNSIIGFSSIILNEWLGPLNNEQRENLSSVLRSGKHLLSLINDVIDVSKIEAKMIEVNIDDFDLDSVIQEAVDSFKNEIKDKKLKLKVESIHQKMHTDRRRLLQSVMNLMSNAIKFTERGSVSIRASIMRNAEFGLLGDSPEARMRNKKEGTTQSAIDIPHFIEIVVEDTGIGIRESEIPRLFNAFVRLESPLKAMVFGTGLGLYLTKKLVQDILKGEIMVVSKEGKGSRFTLRIPVKTGSSSK